MILWGSSALWLDQLQNWVFGFSGCSSPSPAEIQGLVEPCWGCAGVPECTVQALPLFVYGIWEWAFPRSRRGIMGANTNYCRLVQELLLLASSTGFTGRKETGIPSPLGQTATEIV